MVDKIRIAMLIDCYGGSFLGGGQTYLDNIVRILKKDYPCEINVFTQRNAGLVARLVWNLWVVVQVFFHHVRKPFQLIHAQAFSAGISGKILSVILGIPVVYSVHGSHTMDMVGLKYEKKSWKYYFEKYLLTKVKYDKQISVSANFLQYPNVNKQIEVIENGVTKKDIKKFEKNTLDKKIKLLFVGRLEKIKGLEILLHSLVLLENKSQYELKIVGDGSLETSLKALSKKLKLNSVEFVGKKTGDELEKLYLDADLFVLPSIAEGQPIVLLDAWSYKLPVLVTTAGHNPWMVEDGKNGFIVEVGDVSALVKGLKNAFKNHDKWVSMGEAGFKKVTSTYTWEIAVKKLFKEYQKLV